MKTLFKSITLLSFFFGTLAANAQECTDFVQFKEGATITQKTYDSRDRLAATIKQKVIRVTPDSVSTTATLKSEVTDKNNDLQSTSDYTVKCENGTFLIDMQTVISPESMKTFKNMEVKAEADFMEFPSTLTTGQPLKDGKMHMVITNKSGNPFATIDLNISNRKVEASEKTTTPAGTFDTYRIPYDFEMITTALGIPITASGKTIEWYSPGVGIVKSESYNKKDKLTGYTLITEIKQEDFKAGE